MSHKVVIVTGSSQGIGKATAEQLCKAGARVVLNGRNPEKLQKVLDYFKAKGYDVIAVPGDITKAEDCQRIVDQTLEAFDGIDVLINNGSITMNEEIAKLHPDLFESVYMSNSMGAVHPTLAALPHIRKSKGSIVFISSLAGLHAMPGASAYSMGKMALTALWQSMKIELKHSGVHVGICYVSFTQNEIQKRMVSGDGTLVTVPPRPKLLLQSREKVARRILCMLRYRRSKMILSPLGKITAVFVRYLPVTTLRIMTLASTKNRDQN